MNKTMTAAEPLVFKPEWSPHASWMHYGLILAIVLILILILAKKYKPQNMPLAGCQLIEKKHLGNKTMVYIIDYQQQRFILADNQNALAIHPLKPTPSEPQPSRSGNSPFEVRDLNQKPKIEITNEQL